MADEKRGRRPDSPELKGAKMALRKAKTDDEKATARAEVDAITARETAAKADTERRVYSEEEQFRLLVECEPHIREAEEARKRLAIAFGSAAVARKRLNLFRRAQTEDGEAEARELIEMRQRVAALRDVGGSAPAASPEMHAAA